jgi:flagellar hook assembly protein FlgD
MDMLKQIESQLIVLENQIDELTNKRNQLQKEKINIIQSNCKHSFEWTGYCEDDIENNIVNYDMECIKCGHKEWQKV